MLVRYTQEGKSNCGLNAVANAINDGRVLTQERTAAAVKGQSIWLLNKYLAEDGYRYHIETIYKSVFHSKLPKEIDPIPGIDNACDTLPLLMTVQFKEGGINHMIALHVTIDGVIRVMDSLQSDVVETTWDDIHELYPIIYGVYAFVPNDRDGEYMYLSTK